MPDIIGDGKERWDWVPSIANINAPTAAELNAGIRLSQWMTKDGATGWSPETADAPTSSIESTFDTNVNGRRSFNSPRLRFKKQSGSDSAYTTLLPDVTGFVTRRKSLAAATAFASTQPLQVFPVMCGEAAWLDQEDNMPERFDVPMKVTAQPNLRAAVA
jgi:hypothetical protein